MTTRNFSRRRTYLEGLSFGMVLQIAVGPVFFFVVTTGLTRGWVEAGPAVLTVTLADALFILAAILGAGLLFRRPSVKTLLKWVGAVLLVLFGLYQAWPGIAVLTGGTNSVVTISAGTPSGSSWPAWLTAFLMTLSSPLSIVFWTAVFGSRLAEKDWGKRQTAFFSLGCLSATFLFIGAAAVAASWGGVLVPPAAYPWLSLAAGAVIAGFGVRMALHRQAP